MHSQLLVTLWPEMASSSDPGVGLLPDLAGQPDLAQQVLWGCGQARPCPRMWALELGVWRPRPGLSCSLQFPEVTRETLVEFMLHTLRCEKQNRQTREDGKDIF